MTIKKLLITGGAGFIGSHFAEYMLQKHPGIKITILDNFIDGERNIQNVRELIGKYGNQMELVAADITDGYRMFQVFEEGKFDTVVHLAAIGSNLRALENEELARRTNMKELKIYLMQPG